MHYFFTSKAVKGRRRSGQVSSSSFFDNQIMGADVQWWIWAIPAVAGLGYFFLTVAVLEMFNHFGFRSPRRGREGSSISKDGEGGSSARVLPWAPYVPTPHVGVEKMLEMADVRPGDVVFDLGCGDGRIVRRAAQVYEATGVGFELSTAVYYWARLLNWWNSTDDRVTLLCADFWQADLAQT